MESAKKLPTVLSYDMVIWGLFVKWGWKWKALQGWLVPFPNLEGTWRGTYNSTWEDPSNGLPVGEEEIVLVIRQTFLSVHCTALTKEMTSRSYAADFAFDEQSGKRMLVYMYVGDPKQAVRSRSQIHRGASELEILGKESDELRGQYWTDRKSTGDLVFRLETREKADKFMPSSSSKAS